VRISKKSILMWGLVFVPAAALLDTVILQQRTFFSYVGACLIEYCVFWGGMCAGETFGANNDIEISFKKSKGKM